MKVIDKTKESKRIKNMIKNKGFEIMATEKYKDFPERLLLHLEWVRSVICDDNEEIEYLTMVGEHLKKQQNTK